MGEVFPQNVSEHGIALIKAREGHGTEAKTGKLVEVPDLVKRRGKELHMFSAPTCPCDGVAQ
jgi:hypothetical protein